MDTDSTHSQHPKAKPAGKGRPPVRRLMLFTAAFLVSACVTDSTLLNENAAVALRSARFQAREDLNCPTARVSMVSEAEVPGAPWGFLYSDYRIRAEGCGRSVVYNVECRDESLCDVTRVGS